MLYEIEASYIKLKLFKVKCGIPDPTALELGANQYQSMLGNLFGKAKKGDSVDEDSAHLEKRTSDKDLSPTKNILKSKGKSIRRSEEYSTRNSNDVLVLSITPAHSESFIQPQLDISTEISPTILIPGKLLVRKSESLFIDLISGGRISTKKTPTESPTMSCNDSPRVSKLLNGKLKFVSPIEVEPNQDTSKMDLQRKDSLISQLKSKLQARAGIKQDSSTNLIKEALRDSEDYAQARNSQDSLTKTNKVRNSKNESTSPQKNLHQSQISSETKLFDSKMALEQSDVEISSKSFKKVWNTEKLLRTKSKTFTTMKSFFSYSSAKSQSPTKDKIANSNWIGLDIFPKSSKAELNDSPENLPDAGKDASFQNSEMITVANDSDNNEDIIKPLVDISTDSENNQSFDSSQNNNLNDEACESPIQSTVLKSKDSFDVVNTESNFRENGINTLCPKSISSNDNPKEVISGNTKNIPMPDLSNRVSHTSEIPKNPLQDNIESPPTYVPFTPVNPRPATSRTSPYISKKILTSGLKNNSDGGISTKTPQSNKESNSIDLASRKSNIVATETGLITEITENSILTKGNI
jgi:hypothetical protein